jgi:flagellum-specific peptidoglycan hydrolase FlgJ
MSHSNQAENIMLINPATPITHDKTPNVPRPYLIPVSTIDAAQYAQWMVARNYGGINIYASVTLAQWALESGYGQHTPPKSNNPFGIKSMPNDKHCSEVATHEVIKGVYTRVICGFKCYACERDAFLDHAELLAESGHYFASRHTNNPDDFARGLTGSYATDPDYGKKLIQIMLAHNLYRYDA